MSFENDPMSKYQMTDHGTRLEHLMDLQELWSKGLALAMQGYQTHSDKERIKELNIALTLLTAHMQKDFDTTDYARAINALPKNAKDIPGEPTK